MEVDKPAFWDKIYRDGQSGWDLKGPNPVFMEILKNKEIIEPGNILIPGCGKGYDAIAAAKLGFTVRAVDFSQYAISFAKNLALKESVNVNFLNLDFFSLGTEFDLRFDVVYDYTSFCAINPFRREEYIKKISDLLKPGGKLLAHLFPVENRKGGPPFGIDIIETYKIFSKYLTLDFSSGNISSIKSRKGKEVLQIYIKLDNR